MSEKKFQKLTFSDIQKTNWKIADLIRDKGNGKNEDTPYIVYPLLTLKRFLDIREEDKIKRIRNSQDYKNEDHDLNEYLDYYKAYDSRFKVKTGIPYSWYDIQWEDIIRFEKNPDANEINYQLGHPEDEDFKHRLSVKTNAKNKIEFLFEVIESFDSHIIQDMLKEYQFEQVFKKMLSEQDQNEALSIFSEYKYYLECADEDVFGDAYMDITARFAASGGKKGGEFFTPTELTKAVTRMLNPKISNEGNYKIADPTAGACTFMIYAAENIKQNSSLTQQDINNRVTFITQEKEKNSEIFGQLNLALHGYQNHISYHANTITQWKKKKDNQVSEESNDAIGIWEGKIDLILANPPYGLNDYGIDYANDSKEIENRWEYGVPPKGEGEYAFLSSIINLLNEKGRAAVVLPLGTLFKDSTKNMRQRFVELGYIDAIVNMPSNMFLTTGIPVCVWFLSKGKTKEEIEKGVYLMDASECFEKEGKNNKFKGEKAENAIETFLSKTEEIGFSKFVSLEDLKENNYNLSVSRYVFTEDEREYIDIDELNSSISEDYQILFDKNKEIATLF